MNENEKKATTFNFDLEELGPTLEAIANSEHFEGIQPSRKQIVRFAIVRTAKALETGDRLATKADINSLADLLRGIAAVAKATKPGRTGKIVAEDVETVPVAEKFVEEPDEDGIRICEALGGTVSEGSCIFKKYELLPSGRVTDWVLKEPLSGLSNKDIENQYSPSREVVEEALK